MWPGHQYQQFSGSGSLQSSSSSSVVAPRPEGIRSRAKNMRNLCVPLEDNEVTCPCCLQKPPPSRSMRVVHLRVVRFPIPPIPVLVVVAVSVSPASLRVAWQPRSERAGRPSRPGQDEREADRKRSEHAAETACAPCRPRRRVLALFCQSLPGLLISRLFSPVIITG